ncbi:C45 family autoproteolytic acyltransferase/hydolase [Streptomyces camelliae]|uniref:C45 family autoproteolytic acyltransferase/hydrolase n=1 Tax=Streptomyces camelliae TaxID=3004093 RepID=A0ABY7NVV2_9ACTN|nr:C45 family peptidase [Streptomyces sp. HUAS 2-6]WBO61450.1 C45 family autoproteolytic acyltransferase/hydrolase [Streptomyces sp. HUAS 2-6]
MGTEIREQELAGLRWLVVSGERTEVFRALGQAARADVHAVQDALPERSALHGWAATERGRIRVRRVLDATHAAYGRQLAELRALAAGAGADFHDLLLANLRGDLGVDDGTGCTDLGWRRTRSYVAHNEDGAPALDGRLMLLTLLVDGDVPVTVQWYPGFLPANTFTATGHGLVWGINHIQAARPADAPGRHFVARALQQAPTLDAAVDHLRARPSAGGFAYTIGDRAEGRVVVVESAAGRTAVVEADPAHHPLHWHTNHLRHLPDPADAPTAAPAANDGARAARSLGQFEESVARGKALSTLAVPADDPGAQWFLDILTAAPLPHGVHRTAAGTDPLMTLCSVVADLTDDRITVCGPAGKTAEMALSDFAHGRAGAATG